MIYDTVLVGIDGSEEALDAVRLANCLRRPSGHLLAVSVAETPYAIHAGFAAPEWAWRLRAQAEEAREGVLREFHDDPRVQACTETGHASEALLRKIRETESDLVAVGSRGIGRLGGIVLGSVATRIVHDAPCSVLVVRGEFDPQWFPRNIVVGVDGSEPAHAAATLADELAALTRAHVQHVNENEPHKPVHTLVDRSREADLLVVGSRGLHGIASLGSVAERVAHEAACPVLIVRGPFAERIAGHDLNPHVSEVTR